MTDDKKNKVSFWLELIRVILAAIAGLLGGGGASALLS